VIGFGDAKEWGAHAVPDVAALLGAVLVHSSGMVWIKRIGDDSATTAGTLAVSLPFRLGVAANGRAYPRRHSVYVPGCWYPT
jgi:hypothetical protein